MSSHKEKYGVDSYEDFKKRSEERNAQGKEFSKYKEKLTRKLVTKPALKALRNKQK